MTKETVQAGGWAAYQDAAKGLERDYVGEILKSRSGWRRVAFCSMALACMGVASTMLLTPLKRTDTVVVRVDQSSGFVDVVSKLADQTPTQGMAVDKYFLKQYIERRESYDYNTIQADYNRTALYSSGEEQQQFFKLYQGKDARDKVLKNLYRIVVSTKSVSINDKAPGTAVVRFSTEKRSVGSAVPPERQDWIATIGYEYVDAAMAESDRRDNPLGFQVTSYRVDPETVGVQ